MEDNNNLSNTNISFSLSEIDISGIKDKEEKRLNLINSLYEISKAFENIKDLRNNFKLEEYDKYIKLIGHNLKVLRGLYNPKNKKIDKNQKDTKNSQNEIQINSNQQFSSTNQSYINTKMQSNTNNNSNSISEQGNNNKNNNSKIKENIRNLLNDTTFIDFKIENDINHPKNLEEIYNILLEIVSFILCYDDIYINYENKSAYYSLKLLLRISTLHFLKNIKKADFILMIMNKTCNILCKYNQLNKNDTSIKRYLIYNKKELEGIKILFNNNNKFINEIEKKLENEINKFDLNLPNKVEKIKQEAILNEENELKLNFENDINCQFHKLNIENEILENIQNDLDENHKMFLKEPIKKELELFNILLNKLSYYKTPLIKKKFLDIIIRNKEIFKYINENIFLENIPNNIMKKYN